MKLLRHQSENQKLRAFMRAIQVPKKFWIGTFGGYLVSFVFNSFGIVLILPLVKGLIEKDYSFIYNNILAIKLIEFFPNLNQLPNETIFILFASLIVTLMGIAMGINYFISLYVWSQKQYFIMRANNFLLEYYLHPGNTKFTKDKTSAVRSNLVQMGDNVNNYITSSSNLMNSVFDVLSASVILCFISVRFSLIAFVFLAVYFFIFYVLKKVTRNRTLQIQEAAITYNSSLQDIFQRYNLIQIFNTQQKEKKTFEDAFNGLFENRSAVEKVNRLLDPITVLFEVIALFCIGFIIGHSILLSSTLGITGGIVFIVLFQKSLKATSKFSSAYITRSLTRELISKKIDDIDYSTFMQEEQKKQFTGVEKNIEIKNLTFDYEDKALFKNFSAQLYAQKINCIIGPNGSGKSTLLYLIMRLKETPAQAIFIDGTDLVDFGIYSLRKRISYVAQDIKFFYGTIRENLAYSNDYSDEKIYSILEKVDLKKCVEDMPQKLDTLMGNEGLHFSGGQRQRFAIAQALLNDADIIIFDEATKSIDQETENMIMNLLINDFKDKTRIVVTHNPDHIKYADHVVRLGELG